MNGRGWQIAVASTVAILSSSLSVSTPAFAAAGPSVAAGAGCSSGARSLSPYGAHLYPDTGNGGYTSLHTDVHMVYDAVSNTFLPGNHVALDERATQAEQRAIREGQSAGRHDQKAAELEEKL